MSKLILGTASEWKAQVLRDAGIAFVQIPADIDEKAIRYPDPETLVIEIASAKAEALLGQAEAGDVIVAADVIAVFDGQIREKPADADQARRWLRQYSWSSVETVACVAVLVVGDGYLRYGIARGRVHYGDLPESAIEGAVTGTGDVLRACGGFVVEDPHIAPYVTHIEGTIDAIAGMPLDLTLELLAAAGWQP